MARTILGTHVRAEPSSETGRAPGGVSPLNRSSTVLFRRVTTANRRIWVVGLLACCVILFPTGCGPDYKSRGVVRGKVTVGKKALTTGTVMFYGKSGITASATIDPDGNYEMNDAPVGECRVTVSVPTLPTDPMVRARLKSGGMKLPEGPKDPTKSSPDLPSAPRVPKEVVPIDIKFSNPETSGLSFTVQKGEQTFNIDL
jgi:hypothetical protein